MFFLGQWLLINLLQLNSFFLFGQSRGIPHVDPVKVIFYYNSNWELTTTEKHFFKREAYFDLQEMVFDGVYQDYNKNNKLIAEGYYAHGVKSGIQTEHFEDQSIKSTIEFSNNDFIIWQLMNDKKEYEIIKGNGKFSLPYYYFFDFYLKQGTLKGEFQNGKRAGTWIYYDSKKVKTDVEYYEKGRLLNRTYFARNDSAALNSKKEIILSVNAIITESLSFDKELYMSVNQYFESQIIYPPSFQRNVSYPGGLRHLLKLMVEAEVPDQNLVLVKMKIDEHGQILKSAIVRSVDPYTDERVLRVLEIHKTRIIPAMKNGKAYVSTFYLPVSGGESWERMLKEMPEEWFLDLSNFW